MKNLFNDKLIDGILLERYLNKLAESSSRMQQRFSELDRWVIKTQETLDKNRANEAKIYARLSELENANKNIVYPNLNYIQSELKRKEENNLVMENSIRELSDKSLKFDICKYCQSDDIIIMSKNKVYYCNACKKYLS